MRMRAPQTKSERSQTEYRTARRVLKRKEARNAVPKINTIRDCVGVNER